MRGYDALKKGTSERTKTLREEPSCKFQHSYQFEIKFKKLKYFNYYENNMIFSI